MTYMRQSSICCIGRGVNYTRDANCKSQAVALETHVRMLILLVKMDKHLDQSRTAKAAMLRLHPTISSRGDTRHHLLTTPKLYVLSRISRTRELSKWDRLKGATSPR